MQLLVDFAISDQVYAKAKVPVTDSVNLWLGANVMLEYPLDEARDLLVSHGRQAGSCSCLSFLSAMARQSLCAVYIQKALSCRQFDFGM